MKFEAKITVNERICRGYFPEGFCNAPIVKNYEKREYQRLLDHLAAILALPFWGTVPGLITLTY